MNKGRPREFEVSDALDRALLVFWQKGYRGTSLDDLTTAMDINRPSLYAAFGDKEGLFLASIDRYRERYVAPLAKKLLASKDLREGLDEFFRTVAGVVVENETPPGCMIACLLSEESVDSDAIKNKLSDCIGAADAVFTKVFEQHSKQLKKSIDPMVAGRMMTSFVHGMAIRARSGATKRTMEKISESFVNMLVRDAG
jgi:AcrR family transcriptional regulator